MVRLKRAKKLLQDSNMTVKEVASITGWDNQFYFSNSYFKEFGCRPSDKV
jgi:transcriptional regulator GlxA family with amidase domain